MTGRHKTYRYYTLEESYGNKTIHQETLGLLSVISRTLSGVGFTTPLKVFIQAPRCVIT